MLKVLVAVQGWMRQGIATHLAAYYALKGKATVLAMPTGRVRVALVCPPRGPRQRRAAGRCHPQRLVERIPPTPSA